MCEHMHYIFLEQQRWEGNIRGPLQPISWGHFLHMIISLLWFIVLSVKDLAGLLRD